MSGLQEGDVTDNDRFDEKISLSLHRDEAIVLLHYLSREIWMQDEKRLTPSFQHPAEAHGLRALLQELVPPLTDVGGPDSASIHARACESFLNRHR
jgi:hypothetical protein